MAGVYTAGLKNILKCAIKYIFDPVHPFDNNSTSLLDLSGTSIATEAEPTTPIPFKPARGSSFKGFFRASAQPDAIPRAQREIELERFIQVVESEIDNFKAIISKNRCSVLPTITSSGFFWDARDANNNLIFPILSKLALKLISVPSSSAAIERFFSVCGGVIKKNQGRILVDLFIARCMAKANMKLISEMTSFSY